MTSTHQYKGDPLQRSYQSHEGLDPGMSNSELKLKRLKLPSDFSGKCFLDIGCNEGYFCAEAVQRGATRVMGLDVDAAALDFARERYGSLGIEFVHTSWDALPEIEPDVVLWSSAMHYARDPHRVFRNLAEMLTSKGLLILECGVSSGPRREMVLRQRHSDSRWYPTLPFLEDVLLEDYSVRCVTHPYNTDGDPVPRSVYHCRKMLPTVVLVRGETGRGKSTMAGLIGRSAQKLISLDVLVSRIAKAKYHHSSLEHMIVEKYQPESLGDVYSSIDEQFLTDEFADLIAEAVAPTDELVVIEGPMTDAQVVAVQVRLAEGAFVWDASSANPR